MTQPFASTAGWAEGVEDQGCADYCGRADYQGQADYQGRADYCGQAQRHGRAVRSACRGVLNLLLPRGCAGCDAPDEVVCTGCRNGFLRPVQRDLPETLTANGHACGTYRGEVRHAILRWKDHGDEECTPIFAQLLFQLMLFADLPRYCRKPGVLIVPAPSSPQSVRHRGRWHMLPLARHLAALLRAEGVEARPSAMLSMRGPVDKAVRTTDAAQRMSRTKDRIRCRQPYRAAGWPVILLDDIVTTGATVRQCVHAVHDQEIDVIAALSLAHTAQRPMD